VEDLPDLSEVMEALLKARRKLREQFTKLHRKLLAIVRDDTVCRRLMTIPGVGAVTALAYRATIDVSARFRNSKARWRGPRADARPASVGEMSRVGRISLCGDGMMRALLYEGGHTVLTRSVKWSWLKAWAMKIPKNRGLKRAIVALARRLAVIMHRIWVDGAEFRWTKEEAALA
jgi:transposase